MSSPVDQRDVPPRAGSALWWYVWSLVAIGLAVAVISLAGLHQDDLARLVRRPSFWLVAAPMAVTALRPIVPKGVGGDGTFAVVVFLFALLLRVGLPPAALLCTLTLLVRGLVCRHALHRNLFSVGQHVVTLGAAWLVLRAFGINPTVQHAWRFTEPHIKPSELVAVGLAGLVYLAVSNGSSYVAVAMLEDRSLISIVREDRRHLAVVGVAMISLSPLVLIVMVHQWPLVPLFYPALFALYYSATLSVAREHDALHDSLTGLGNRQLLHREASRALGALPRHDGGIAVLVLDIDGFKHVNDTLGHAAGDQLLQVVAERLNAALRRGDVVARLGGDEFVMVASGVADLAAARTTAVRLLERVNGRCQIDGQSIDLAASLGVALAPDHGLEFEALLRRADRAMYIAKAAGCGIAVFDLERDEDRYTMREPVVVAQGPESPPEVT